MTDIPYHNCFGCNECETVDLYKVKDATWIEAGIDAHNPCACLDHLIAALDRPLTPDDADIAFPMWAKDTQAQYYRGFRDGVTGVSPTAPSPSDGQYEAGVKMGLRFRQIDQQSAG